MIVLDTNVISELMNPDGSERVLIWAGSVPRARLFTTAISEAEVLYGLARMPEGRKRRQRIEAAAAMFEIDFDDRILPFDRPAARRFAEIAAGGAARGRPIAAFDAQIAAIAISRGMLVATRNTRHFSGCGVAVVDPWTD